MLLWVFMCYNCFKSKVGWTNYNFFVLLASLQYVQNIFDQQILNKGLRIAQLDKTATCLSTKGMSNKYLCGHKIVIAELLESLSCLSDNRSGRCGQCRTYQTFAGYTFFLQQLNYTYTGLIHKMVCLQLQVIPWNTQS
jgi:hypothetical protein